METITSEPTGVGSRKPEALVLGSAGVAALVSASCCILPLGLTIVGLGGSWLSMLGPFVAYRVPILLLVGVIIVWTWYRLIRTSGRGSVITGLNVATTAAFAAAVSAPLWENEVMRVLWAYWTEQ